MVFVDPMWVYGLPPQLVKFHITTSHVSLDHVIKLKIKQQQPTWW